MKREMTRCCASPVIVQAIQLKCHDGQSKMLQMASIVLKNILMFIFFIAICHRA